MAKTTTSRLMVLGLSVVITELEDQERTARKKRAQRKLAQRGYRR